ncbi:unnamed protein product [Amaranthus hypochondriacus]
MNYNDPPNNNPNDPFDYDPNLLLDDELLELINSVYSPINSTPQINDISALFPAATTSQNQSHEHNNVVDEQQLDPLKINPPAPIKGDVKRKSKATEIERKRRKEMSSLYQDLRALLPPEYLTRKRSIADLLHEATNYIVNLQNGVKGLTETRDELLKSTSNCNNNINNNNNNNNNYCNPKNNVTVKCCKDGIIEVIVSTSAVFDDNNKCLPLSRLLHLLTQHGLHVINCVSSRSAHNTMVHTIQSQVNDERQIDPCVLQQTLMAYI